MNHEDSIKHTLPKYILENNLNVSLVDVQYKSDYDEYWVYLTKHLRVDDESAMERFLREKYKANFQIIGKV